MLPLLYVACTLYLQAVGADTIRQTEGSMALNSSHCHEYSGEVNLILFRKRRKGSEKILLKLLAQKGEF